MYRFTTLISFIFYVTSVFGDNNKPFVSAASAGLGYSRVSFYGNYSLFTNQAGIAFQEDKTVTLHYRQVYFTELTQGGLGFVYPLKNISFGLSFYDTGFDEARNQSLGLAIAIKITPGLAMGLNISWFRSQAEGHITNHQAIPEFGILSKINERLHYGLHIYNPSPVFFDNNESDYQMRQPLVFATGFSYMAQKNLRLTSEISKIENLATQIHVGLNYCLEKITIRTGFLSAPAAYTLGIGYKLKGLNVDIALAYHEKLGITPQSSFAYGWQ